MRVKRYDFDGIPDPCAVIGIPRKAGEYVKYSEYAALLARHNALREAVAWERECGKELMYQFDADFTPAYAFREMQKINAFARAEVDRLLMEEK